MGIAGGAEKCAFALNELGFDAAVDHRRPNCAEELARACPQGIDVYFENVGGKVWDAVFPLFNPFARIPVCGLIAQYNVATGETSGPDRLADTMRTVLTKSLQIRGFIQSEFASQRDRFYNEASEWLARGQLRYREDIVDGLENAPEAFIGLLQGRNFGKLVIRVASDAVRYRGRDYRIEHSIKTDTNNCSCCQFWYRALNQSQESGVASPRNHATARYSWRNYDLR